MKRVLVLATLLGALANAATVATVDGQKIDEQDLYGVMQQITRGQYAQLPDASKEQVKKVAIDQIISQILIQKEAVRAGVAQTPEYKEALKVTLARIEPQLGAEIWLKSEFDKIKVTDKALKKFYDENKEEFAPKKEVHARHILVNEEAKANELAKTLNALKGDALKAKFMELAKANSRDGSAQSGGDLGFFPQGAMVPEFEKAVFAMQKGSVTPKPVKTQFGYHLIYLEETRGGEKRSYDEVKPQVEQALKSDIFQKELKAKMEKLKASAKISYN
ncbi:MAG: hypothetical protein KU37_04970 [Sulfuricurvum sp. PC08-66]|nr:MAG: hypothetical protein KU37_04970 [Sulfuricurvum sp. PC08-66]